MRDFHDDNRTERWMEARSVAEIRSEQNARWNEGVRCPRCNEMHDQSPLALAMCKSAAAVLDEEDRPGTARAGILHALRATAHQDYTAWRAV